MHISFFQNCDKYSHNFFFWRILIFLLKHIILYYFLCFINKLLNNFFTISSLSTLNSTSDNFLLYVLCVVHQINFYFMYFQQFIRFIFSFCTLSSYFFFMYFEQYNKSIFSLCILSSTSDLFLLYVIWEVHHIYFSLLYFEWYIRHIISLITFYTSLCILRSISVYYTILYLQVEFNLNLQDIRCSSI